MAPVGVEQSLTEDVHYRIEALHAGRKCASVPLRLAMDMARADRRVMHICGHMSCWSCDFLTAGA